MEKLKIVMISTLWERTPPVYYGGTERVVSYLTEELVKRGHQVTLFATKDSVTKARLFATYPRALYRDKIPWSSYYDNLILYSRAMEYAIKQKVDIIHSHGPYYSLPFIPLVPIPMLHTLHGNISRKVISADKVRMLLAFKEANFVSISNSQRKLELNYVKTVYNGIPVSRFTFNPKGGDYLVWLGRFTPVKGAKEAVEIAKAVKMPLMMAGKVDWAVERDREYFQKFIKPHLKKKEVEYIGEINHAQKNKLMGSAFCLLNPISWDEPFGLVPAEANACGTPVIAFAKGSMSELIKRGLNGFLVKPGDTKGMINALKKLLQMPKDKYYSMRRACREHAEKNFSIEKMADGYEKAYQEVLRRHR